VAHAGRRRSREERRGQARIIGPSRKQYSDGDRHDSCRNSPGLHPVRSDTAGVALFTTHAAGGITGLFVITAYKLGFGDFSGVPCARSAGTARPRMVTLANLLGCCWDSRCWQTTSNAATAHLAAELPADDWKGGFVLLLLVFVLSSFLDNIAAAMIAAPWPPCSTKSASTSVFSPGSSPPAMPAVRQRVGDTTTTMMWIAGVPALQYSTPMWRPSPHRDLRLLRARQQHALQPIMKADPLDAHFEGPRLPSSRSSCWPQSVPIVLQPAQSRGAESLPCHRHRGVARDDRHRRLAPAQLEPVARMLRGSIFLLSLVMCAAMMRCSTCRRRRGRRIRPGFHQRRIRQHSLTALALAKRYDWGFVAYAVGSAVP